MNDGKILSAEKKKQISKTFHVYGDSTDAITQVQSETHVTVKARDSKVIGNYFTDVQMLNRETDDVLRQSHDKISKLEEKTIQNLMKEQDKLVKKLLEKGTSLTNQCEQETEKRVEKVIKKLKLEMVNHIDASKREIEQKKRLISETTGNCVKDIREKSENAKTEFHNRLRSVAREKLNLRLVEKQKQMTNSKQQSISIERANKTNVRSYATAGDVDRCSDDVADLADNLKKVEPRPAVKRTVFLQTNDFQDI